MQKNNFAVVLKENSEIIGTIGLNEDADGNENILNVGGENCSATDVLSWFCTVDDLRSQHIAKKLGFVYIKTFAKAEYNLLSDFYYYILEKNSNSF